MQITVSSDDQFKLLLEKHNLLFCMLPNGKATDSDRLLINFKGFAEKYEGNQFILFDEKIKDTLSLPFSQNAPVTYYIIRDGYMLFRRDYEIWYNDVETSLQFASAINMSAWIKEEPRIKLV